METPLYDTIHRLSSSEGRFHVPGHKGNPRALPFMGGALKLDFTEVEGADDLQHPTGPIAKSEENMASLYKSGATLYSASGSTSCVQAMLTLFLSAGDTVVMARNCHLSAVRALAFLGCTPHWVLPKNGYPQPGDIEKALGASGAKAVYITSPDYYGRIADIETIAGLCRSHGAKLMVDNAHGAHLKFLAPDLHPLHRGADACCDSAHKTLPCVTPAALLHLADSGLKPAARRALNLYSSTSPSYLVLQSLDWAAGLLAGEAPPDFMAAAGQLAAAASQNPAIVQPGDDPLKLCLHPARAGVGYTETMAALAARGITPELADGARIVLLASPYNTPGAFSALAAALGSLPGTPAAPPAEPSFSLQAPACSIREAVFSQKELLPAGCAVGRIAAEVCAPCPPGIPVVVPGERVDETAARLLAEGGISTISVVK